MNSREILNQIMNMLPTDKSDCSLFTLDNWSELYFGKNNDGTYNMTVDSAGNAVFAGTVEAADATFVEDSRELVTAGQLYNAGIVPGNAQGVNSMAIGSNSQAISTQDVAIGYSAAATGGSAVALGLQSSANGSQSVALGVKSAAIGANSVALGANSVADRADTVSVGSVITNVAEGREGTTDAVNMKQIERMVEWDEGTNNQIHGVTLENGNVTANIVNAHNVAVDNELAAGKANITGTMTAGSAAIEGNASVNGQLTASTVGANIVNTHNIAVDNELTAGKANITGQLTADSAHIEGTAVVDGVATVGGLTSAA